MSAVGAPVVFCADEQAEVLVAQAEEQALELPALEDGVRAAQADSNQQRHAVAQVQVRGRGIEARLDAEGAPLFELRLQLLHLVAGDGALGEQGQGFSGGSGRVCHL